MTTSSAPASTLPGGGCQLIFSLLFDKNNNAVFSFQHQQLGRSNFTSLSDRIMFC
jgi:hypothetical protein